MIKNKISKLLALQLTLLLALYTGIAHADAFEQFLGTYVGETTSEQNGKEVKRDLSVEITTNKKGFHLKWVTTKIKASGKTSTKSYDIDFEPTDRDNIYSSAMKANLFGGRQPLDPMKGDPYVWARFTGDEFTVHAMIITEEGGYEMLTYQRRLVEGGLDLEFTRVKNGEPQRKITAHLKKVD